MARAVPLGPAPAPPARPLGASPRGVRRIRGSAAGSLAPRRRRRTTVQDGQRIWWRTGSYGYRNHGIERRRAGSGPWRQVLRARAHPAVRVETTVDRSNGTCAPSLCLRPAGQVEQREGREADGQRGNGPARNLMSRGLLLRLGQNSPDVSAASRRRISCHRVGRVEFMAAGLQQRPPRRARCRSDRLWRGSPRRGGPRGARHETRARDRPRARRPRRSLSRRRPGGHP